MDPRRQQRIYDDLQKDRNHWFDEVTRLKKILAAAEERAEKAEARAEALERAIKKVTDFTMCAACESCVSRDDCDKVSECGDESSLYWQFDQDKYTSHD